MKRFHLIFAGFNFCLAGLENGAYLLEAMGIETGKN